MRTYKNSVRRIEQVNAKCLDLLLSRDYHIFSSLFYQLEKIWRILAGTIILTIFVVIAVIKVA